MTTRERPILFSAPMVRAILAGIKSQTRRIVKPQPYVDGMGNFCWNGSNFGQDFKGPRVQAIASPVPSSKTKRVHCPYGRPGDVLWVREAHWWYEDSHDPVTGYFPPPLTIEDVEYRADGNSDRRCWRSPIHMPRWASRIDLRITDVRVERLQDISPDDAKAEAAPCYVCGNPMTGLGDDDCYCFRRRPDATDFRNAWEFINGPGSWDANPWVWVVEFERIKP